MFMSINVIIGIVIWIVVAFVIWDIDKWLKRFVEQREKEED